MTLDMSPAARFASSLRTGILPRPARGVRKKTGDGPIVVAGMFRTANGLGEAAKLTALGLRDLGYDPILVDLSAIFRQVDQEPFDTLGSLPKSSRGTLILQVNAPETRLALRMLGLRRWHNWRIIGYWAWELSEAPASWLPIAEHLTEIWTPSEFVTRTLSPRVNIPVLTVPHPVRMPQEISANSLSRPADAPLRVLAMADGRSSFYRKNVLAAARLYCRAFDPASGSELTIKLRNVSEFPEFQHKLRHLLQDRDDVNIIEGTINSKSRWDLIASHDIMLSTHRAEGFGLHLAEAMTLGLCPVATGWSGNTQFMKPKNSVLLPYELESVFDPYGVYDPPPGSQWAKVNEEAGAEVLRSLNADRDKLMRLRRAAMETDFVANSAGLIEQALTSNS